MRRLAAVFGLVALLGAAAPGSAESDSDEKTTREQDAPAGDDDDSEDDSKEESDREAFEREEELFEVPDDEPDEPTADEQGTEGRERRRDVSLTEMSRGEAERAGFDFGDERETGRRTTGSFLAATGGLVAHGLGHWYVEDPRTALTLAAAEGGSLAFLGTGLGLWLTRPDGSVGRRAGAASFHLGAGLFGLSYLVDLVGTLQDARLRLPPNTGGRSGLALQLGYRYVHAGNDPLNHYFVGRADVGAGPVFGELRTRQEFRFETSDYKTEVGVRLLRGSREMTRLYTVLRADWFVSQRGAGMRRLRGEARLGGSLDLGAVAPHLEQIVVGADLGGGMLGYRRPVGGEGSDFAWAERPWYLPVEVYADLNLSERLNGRIGYDKRPGEPLQPNNRLGGVGEVRFRYDSSELFDLQLEGRFGDGYSLQAGLIVRLAE